MFDKIDLEAFKDYWVKTCLGMLKSSESCHYLNFNYEDRGVRL